MNRLADIGIFGNESLTLPPILNSKYARQPIQEQNFIPETCIQRGELDSTGRRPPAISCVRRIPLPVYFAFSSTRVSGQASSTVKLSPAGTAPSTPSRMPLGPRTIAW